MNSPISPCPFCSSRDVRIEDYDESCSVACYRCGGIGPTGESADEAVSLWNSRSALASSFHPGTAS